MIKSVNFLNVLKYKKNFRDFVQELLLLNYLSNLLNKELGKYCLKSKIMTSP